MPVRRWWWCVQPVYSQILYNKIPFLTFPGALPPPVADRNSQNPTRAPSRSLGGENPLRSISAVTTKSQRTERCSNHADPALGSPDHEVVVERGLKTPSSSLQATSKGDAALLVSINPHLTAATQTGEGAVAEPSCPPPVTLSSRHDAGLLLLIRP